MNTSPRFARAVLAFFTFGALQVLLLAGCDVARSAETSGGIVGLVGSSTGTDDGRAAFSVVVYASGETCERVVTCTRAYLNEDGLLSLSQTIRPARLVTEDRIVLRGGGHSAEASLSGAGSWVGVSSADQIQWTVE